jgi:hypothetical protein
MASQVFGTGLPPTAALKKSQKLQFGSIDDDMESLKLSTQDNFKSKPPLYIYNICELPHTRNQPPEFPAFAVEPCQKGEKFSCKIFPGLVKERYVRPGTSEYYYREVDGRKYATSLLNPDIFPGTDWEAQLIEGTTGNNDMTGMNMNALGVFWSELAPDDPKLNEQIRRVRARVDRTMDFLVKEGNRHNAEGKLGNISPMMHFAMEYFGLSAPWHMSHRHKTECPNCGDLVLEGIAYHRNASGDICIIDRERYEASVVPAEKQKEAPAASAARQPKARTAK